MGGTAVSCRGLGRRFGRRWALAHVDLEFARGESVLLAGANGSGKTTLLRVLAGLSTPTRGEVLVHGKDPHVERISARSRISLVSHASYLYDELTASEMVDIWERLAGREPSGDRDDLLAEVGLAEHRDQLIGGFSAGMRKRLTLARIHIERPDLLLLDEPLAALDADGQGLVERWIRGAIESGVTVIVASHAVDRMARLCARGLLLEDGQLVWDGSGAALPEAMASSNRRSAS